MSGYVTGDMTGLDDYWDDPRCDVCGVLGSDVAGAVDFIATCGNCDLSLCRRHYGEPFNDDLTADWCEGCAGR